MPLNARHISSPELYSLISTACDGAGGGFCCSSGTGSAPPASDGASPCGGSTGATAAADVGAGLGPSWFESGSISELDTGAVPLGTDANGGSWEEVARRCAAAAAAALAATASGPAGGLNTPTPCFLPCCHSPS